MPFLKGEKKDGYVVINSNVEFAGNFIGGGMQKQGDSKFFFVDGKKGNDNNGGSTWAGAFKTIGAACTAVTARHISGNYPWTGYWGDNDHIIIAGGIYAEALTAIPKGCTFVGMGNAFANQNEYSRTGVVWKPASTSSAINQAVLFCNSFHNIRFRSSGAGMLIETEASENLYFEDCVFQGIAGSTTHGVYVGDSWLFGGMKHCQIADCNYGLYIDYDATQTYTIHSFHNVIIDDLMITGGTNAGIFVHTQQNPSASCVKNTYIGNATTTLALGIDDNSGNLAFHNVYVIATDNDPADLTSGNYSAVYLNGALES